MQFQKYFHKIESLLTRHNHLVAVIVPVYQNSLSGFEKVSLIQCERIFSKYPIILIIPQDILVDLESNDLLKDLRKETFEPEYFKSITSYNRLMISPEFYERFIEYQFILIYQLDAYVFDDELKKWCDLNYDYVGAPWIPANADWLLPKNYFFGWYYQLQALLGKSPVYHEKYVGNGGFSLRKVKAHLLALYLLRRITRNWFDHEDTFWGLVVPGFLPWFRVPDFSKALEFSFETNPKSCFELNHRNIPFGCHAWWTYDLDFWRTYIDIENRGS